MSFSLPPPGTAALLLAVVLVAAVYDVRYRRIPNWLNVTGVLAGIALNTFLYQGLPGLGFALKGLFLAFGIYAVLYALHAMGAGDVKLMAAVGAIVGWENWFGIFLVTAVVGGIMSIILSVSRGRLKKTLFNVGFILSEMKSGRPAYLANEELDVKSNKALRLPHGATIAVGSLFFLALSAHFK
jgi:prepilin peptidase CpaA